MSQDTNREGQADPLQPPVGQTSPEIKGETSEGDKPRVDVFLKEDVDKIVSDRLSTQGRELADLRKKAEDRDRLAEEAETSRKQLDALREMADSEEYNRVKDDPDALAQLNQRRNLAEERRKVNEDRATLAAEKAQHAEKLGRMAKWEVAEAIASAVKEHPRVTEADILACGPESPEEVGKAVELAEKIKGSSQSPETPPSDKGPDPGISSGGGLSWEETKKRYARGEISTKDYEEEKKKAKGG